MQSRFAGRPSRTRTSRNGLNRLLVGGEVWPAPQRVLDLKTQGELVECEYRSDASRRWLKMDFCPQCGTMTYHTAEIRPRAQTVACGTFDDPTWFSVGRHIWVQSKLL